PGSLARPPGPGAPRPGPAPLAHPGSDDAGRPPSSAPAPDYRGGPATWPGRALPASAAWPVLDSPGTTAHRTPGPDIGRRGPHYGGAPGSVASPGQCRQCPDRGTCARRRIHPDGTRCPRVPGALPAGASVQPHVGPDGRAVPRVLALSVTPLGCGRTDISPATSARVGRCHRLPRTGPAPGRRCARPPGLPAPCWPPTPAPGQSASPTPGGGAQGCWGAPAATPGHGSRRRPLHDARSGGQPSPPPAADTG